MTTIAEDKAEAIEVEVSAKSTLIGRKLKENILPRGVLLGAIVRENEVIIPKGDDELKAGDHALVLALKESVGKVDDLFSRGERGNSLSRLMKTFSSSKPEQ